MEKEVSEMNLTNEERLQIAKENGLETDVYTEEFLATCAAINADAEKRVREECRADKARMLAAHNNEVRRLNAMLNPVGKKTVLELHSRNYHIQEIINEFNSPHIGRIAESHLHKMHEAIRNGGVK